MRTAQYRSNTGIAFSNLSLGVGLVRLCVVLSCLGRGLALGRPTVKSVLRNVRWIRRFIINAKFEQTT
jgi:hypothetical protein